MISRIQEASISMDSSILDEVMALMLEIKGAWDQISDVDKQVAYAEQG
jgi:flagellar protein FliS